MKSQRNSSLERKLWLYRTINKLSFIFFALAFVTFFLGGLSYLFVNLNWKIAYGPSIVFAMLFWLFKSHLEVWLSDRVIRNLPQETPFVILEEDPFGMDTIGTLEGPVLITRISHEAIRSVD